MRMVLAILAHLLVWSAVAQDMGHVHLCERVAEVSYNSAEANALAWWLHRQDAPHCIVRGSDMVVVGEALDECSSQRHTSGALPGLTHVAKGFSSGHPVALGVADDLGLAINFTARREYRVTTWSQHLTVRALLSRLLVE